MSDHRVSPFEQELQDLIGQAKRNFSGDAYKASVFDAYVFGYSFAWLYAKEQLQLNGAAGSRGVNIPVNSFYTNATPDAISTGGVAPDANVLYANAFLRVLPASPVVVQLPDVQNELQFFSVQSANSATQNYQTPYPTSTIDNQSSIQSVENPSGGQVLFYWGTDDPDQYAGEFTQRIAVNTITSFLTGRVLVDPALVKPQSAYQPDTYAVSTVAALNQQFVAASFDRFSVNGNTMAGLQNESNTNLTSDVQAAYRLYSGSLNGEFFWQTLAQALNQSPPPAFGIGSEAGLQGTPLAYSRQLSDFGVVYTEADGYQFDRSAVTNTAAWIEATDIAYDLVTGIETFAADNASASWQNVPATLGDYANSLVGYLMRDVAHIANSPASAVYPLTYNDSAGESLSGANTYVMVIRNALASGLPPLAPANVSAMSNLLAPQFDGLPTVMNQGGFWSFTAYDQNLNVTPAINQSVLVGGQLVEVDYTTSVAQVTGTDLPADTFFNPRTGSAPYTLSSLQVAAALGQVSGLASQPVMDSIPIDAQFRFEENGDLLLILSPYRPVDSRYWNNWLPTPLMNFNPDFSTVTDPEDWQPFYGPDLSVPTGQGVPFSLMLRVYNPNVTQSELGEAVMRQAAPGSADGYWPGQVWTFPTILELPDIRDEQDWVAYFQSNWQDRRIDLTPDTEQAVGGLGLNTAVVAAPRSAFEVSNDGISLSVRGQTEAGEVNATLTNYQQIEFSDMTIVFDLVGAPNVGVYSLYQTAFDRMPDLQGFRYWSQVLSSGQADLNDIAYDFSDSAEYLSSDLDEMTDEQFLDAIYANAFERTPDASGFEFWLTALENGAARADVLAGFAASQESWNLVMSEQPVGLAML